MVPLVISFEDRQVSALRKLSSETGISTARYVREAVDRFFSGGLDCLVSVGGQTLSGCILVLRQT
jgi:predicted DNA-binding protein